MSDIIRSSYEIAKRMRKFDESKTLYENAELTGLPYGTCRARAFKLGLKYKRNAMGRGKNGTY